MNYGMLCPYDNHEQCLISYSYKIFIIPVILFVFTIESRVLISFEVCQTNYITTDPRNRRILDIGYPGSASCPYQWGSWFAIGIPRAENGGVLSVGMYLLFRSVTWPIYLKSLKESLLELYLILRSSWFLNKQSYMLENNIQNTRNTKVNGCVPPLTFLCLCLWSVHFQRKKKPC